MKWGGGIIDSAYFNMYNFKEYVTHKDLLRQDYIGSTSQPLIRKRVFEVCGLFDEKFPARQDYEMWIRISSKFKIVGIKRKLFIHNIHNNEQISKNPYKSLAGYSMLYKKYRSEYKKDIIAFINIQHSIANNQKGIAAAIKRLSLRIIMKFIRIIRKIIPQKLLVKKVCSKKNE